MQRQRFEYKYLLEEEKALEVRHFATQHLELDEASIGKHNASYRVNSLYVDSDNLVTFYDWVNSSRNRFKLRLRYYEDRSQVIEPNSPVFLEIKRRVSACILKQRCAVRKAAVPIVLAGQMPPHDLILSSQQDSRQRDALSNFVEIVGRLEAKPTALVTYLREAYVDPVNEAVRVTLDRQVRIGLRKTVDFTVDMADYVEPFSPKVILELKFTNRFPDWFGEMVRVLGLTRGAAAKYCEGIAALLHPELGNDQGGRRSKRQALASELTGTLP
ncbi:MAG: polyphosphate polymerase domain-containing protein [Verrucomicrobia bacterium]|nr:polyphosphate polymerase domain-containing protein [Verrucomicrobiota bacterium]